MTEIKRVLLTGAAGQLGILVSDYLTRRLEAGELETVTLSDVQPVASDHPQVRCVQCDLADEQAVDAMVQGVDAIIHLGGISVESDWKSLTRANLVGSINLWEAAQRRGIDRIIFASSNHAVGRYPSDEVIDHTAPVRPDSRYGVTKSFGEDLAWLYSARGDVRGFCIRIGSCLAEPKTVRHRSTLLQHDDFMQLLAIGLAGDYRFEVVFGASDVPRPYWDNRNAERLGYRPTFHPQDFERFELADDETTYVGGPFAVGKIDVPEL
ncbi:NAD-dependent epimerase/dehydratase family protein [Kushneria phosphatilytica]|uniref:NAD-dependent epimerase/dehydratase family protein n=1 Tax=Kushneria phosphatilytica TaxID=657387 RepID=UPI0008D9BFCA|nr:NAD(P)-dependent oxidoreductase [Kushneria phosphatilytica]OHV07584.1 hypothetical protein BH688_15325 [Kushneria phosphatilytica]